LLIFREILTKIYAPKHWTEISIKRKKFYSKHESHTIAGARGLQFTFKGKGTCFEWRMTHKGRAYKMHIGSVQEVSLEATESQCEVARRNVKGGLHPRHSHETHGDLTFQQAYDEFLMSSEFAVRKPDYQANFRYRMEKYAVEGIGISPLQGVLREKHSIFQHNKIGALKLSDITKQLARQLRSTIRDAENHSVAKIVKSYCKVVVDRAMQNKDLQIQFNPFGFSVPRLPIQQNNAASWVKFMTLPVRRCENGNLILRGASIANANHMITPGQAIAIAVFKNDDIFSISLSFKQKTEAYVYYT
jgi:hypothetical protein